MKAHEAVVSYLDGAEDRRKRELIWGVVREPPAPFWPHQEVVTRATVLLYQHVAPRELGKVTGAPLDVVLDGSRGLIVQPDVVFLSTERLRLVRHQVWGAPDLVVEVESRGTRRYDRVSKRRWYGEYGAREYWLIDVERRAITVVRFGEDGVETSRTFRGRARIRSTVLPDFAEPAAAFFD
ncbi:MAG: Uma2 family endonuclease [Acidobacteria bacterium]|nr:Uma2 family endonuclease [Acidobacteriota bacterium]